MAGAAAVVELVDGSGPVDVEVADCSAVAVGWTGIEGVEFDKEGPATVGAEM